MHSSVPMLQCSKVLAFFEFSDKKESKMFDMEEDGNYRFVHAEDECVC